MTIPPMSVTKSAQRRRLVRSERRVCGCPNSTRMTRTTKTVATIRPSTPRAMANGEENVMRSGSGGRSGTGTSAMAVMWYRVRG